MGFNYIYYAPPGAQVLFTNPLFVRSHDFFGSRGSQSNLVGHRGYGQRLARQCRGTLDGFAQRAALRTRRGRAELPDSFPRTGADLGRSGAANDLERGDPTLVERDANAVALGGIKHGLCGIHTGAGGFERRTAGGGDRGAGSLSPASAPEEDRRLLQAGEPRIAEDNILPSEMYLLARELAPGGSRFAAGPGDPPDGGRIARRSQP